MAGLHDYGASVPGGSNAFLFWACYGCLAKNWNILSWPREPSTPEFRNISGLRF